MSYEPSPAIWSRRDFLSRIGVAGVAGASVLGEVGGPQALWAQAKPVDLTSLRFLCLDPAEFETLVGLRQRVTPARKEPRTPVFEPQVGQFDSLRVFNHGTVLHDQNRFRMWYGAMGQPDAARPWWEWLRAGYAESEDGIQWRRVAVTPDGSHIVPDLPHTCCVYKDELAADPAYRYLALHFANSGEQRQLAESGQYDPKADFISGHLWTSADGIRWQKEASRVRFVGDKPLSFAPQCFFRDLQAADPARRWKAYGFSSLTLRSRAGIYAYSADGRTWTVPASNPILKPVERGAPKDSTGPAQHIHDTVVWRYSGYYLAFYQYLYGPDQADVELAVSRDGEHFTFVAPGEKVIARGGPGEWDRGEILPTVPVIVGDEVWLYYGASDYYHPSDGPFDRKRADTSRVCAGLARLPLGRFAYFEPQANATESYLMTRSIRLPGTAPLKLIVNAACGPGDSLTIEVQTAAGMPLAGYARKDCVPIAGDSSRHVVTWRTSGEQIRPAEQPLKVRFDFRGAARLYGFTWLPATDG